MLSEAFEYYINKDQPFGPIDAAEVTDAEVASLLFDKENKIYRKMSQNPSILIGRKGSGKTAFLAQTKNDKRYAFVVELTTWEAFATVIDAIDKASERLFVEACAKLWEVAIWNAFIHKFYWEIAKKSAMLTDADSNKISSYLKHQGLEEKELPEKVMSVLIDVFRTKSADKPQGLVAEFIHKMNFGGVSFQEAREIVDRYMGQHHFRGVVILDSMDTFPLDQGVFVQAFAGLLHCMGSINSGKTRCHVRFCLPAELFHIIRDKCSRNILKDFRRSVMLHWSSSELVRIAAHRYKIFLELYHVRVHEALFPYKLEDRGQAVSLLNEFFPKVIVNGLGFEEHLIPYIVRHTQLLPRHILVIFNSIAVEALRRDMDTHRFSQEAILAGVRKAEERICSEIFNAFTQVYPDARAICEKSIKHLPICFTQGDLHTAYNHHIKGRISIEYEEFVRLLLEIGAVGRVVTPGKKLKDEYYVVGQFEYTEPGRLIVASNDLLCTHPLFSGVFRADRSREVSPSAVYPFGAALDGDYRD